jgi:predicted nucleic acid-binding protein
MSSHTPTAPSDTATASSDYIFYGTNFSELLKLFQVPPAERDANRIITAAMPVVKTKAEAFRQANAHRHNAAVLDYDRFFSDGMAGIEEMVKRNDEFTDAQHLAAAVQRTITQFCMRSIDYESAKKRGHGKHITSLDAPKNPNDSDARTLYELKEDPAPQPDICAVSGDTDRVIQTMVERIGATTTSGTNRHRLWNAASKNILTHGERAPEHAVPDYEERKLMNTVGKQLIVRAQNKGVIPKPGDDAFAWYDTVQGENQSTTASKSLTSPARR